MPFIDEMKFHAKAGRGGIGVVRWRHEHTKEWSGASGGNGGRGGDVRVRAVRDLGILQRYRNIKAFDAQKGEDGQKDSRHGANGQDLVIDLPIGSIITDHRTGHTFQLLEEGDTIRILKGGSGGLGNEHFKASTNTTPMQSTNGYDGEEADFTVELELVADAGFIGLPNAGKSSLLNALTNADARVGSYAFTTLEPNLGALYNFVLADIPGLIEGASEGKGLGHKFLRHVRRTKMLFHLVSLEEAAHVAASVPKKKNFFSSFFKKQEDSNPLVTNYETIRAELQKYGHGLDEKPEIIILTKTDAVDAAVLAEAKRALSKLNKDIFSVSVLDDESLKNLKDEIVRRLRALK